MHFVFSTLLFVAGTWLANPTEVRQDMRSTSCFMCSRRNLSSCLQAQKLEPFILKNHRGVEAHILPYGAIVQRLTVPDRSGRPTDVVLGFDTLTPYEVSMSVLHLPSAPFPARRAVISLIRDHMSDAYGAAHHLCIAIL